jgi:hypothetical protein
LLSKSEENNKEIIRNTNEGRHTFQFFAPKTKIFLIRCIGISTIIFVLILSTHRSHILSEPQGL